MRGKQGVRVFMLSPHGRMSPFQQAQMFSLQDEQHPQHRHRRRVSTTARTSSRRQQRPGFKRRHDRHRQLHQLGAAAGAGGVLLCGLFPGDHLQRAAGELHGAQRQLRQRLRRACGAHDGLADPPPGAGHQRERRARRVLPHRRYRVRASADTHETSSPSMDISKASNFERFVFDLLGRDGARQVMPVDTDAVQRVHHPSIAPWPDAAAAGHKHESAIAFAGYSGAGKTTLIEQLIPLLRQQGLAGVGGQACAPQVWNSISRAKTPGGTAKPGPTRWWPRRPSGWC
jgi:hypothetical protein